MAKREVTCECGHTFTTSKDKPRCGKCRKLINLNKDSKDLASVKDSISGSIPPKGIPYIAPKDTMSSKNIKFTAKALNIAEELQKKNIYSDLNDVVINAIEKLPTGLQNYTKAQYPTNDPIMVKRQEVLIKQEDLRMAQLDKELKILQGNQKGNGSEMVDISQMMNKSLQQQMLHAQIKSMMANISNDNGNSHGQDPMTMLLMMQAFGNKNNNNNSQDEFMKLMMLKMMSGNNGNGNNKDIESLKEELKRIQADQQQKQMIDLIKSMASKKNDDSLSVKDILAMNAEKEKSSKDMDGKLQVEREKRMQAEMDMRVKEIESTIMSQGGDMSKGKISELKDSIQAIKDTAKEISGETEKKASNNELIAGVIQTGINAFGPAVNDYVQQKRDTTQQPMNAPQQGSGRPAHVSEITPEQFERLSSADQEKVVAYQRKMADAEQTPPEQAPKAPSADEGKGEYSGLISVS